MFRELFEEHDLGNNKAEYPLDFLGVEKSNISITLSENKQVQVCYCGDYILVPIEETIDGDVERLCAKLILYTACSNEIKRIDIRKKQIDTVLVPQGMLLENKKIKYIQANVPFPIALRTKDNLYMPISKGKTGFVILDAHCVGELI